MKKHAFNDQVTFVILKMITILDKTNSITWSDKLKKLLEIYLEDESNIIQIKHLFGGMGSLNDLVLYSDGKLLFDENQDFDALRTNLYETIVAIENINVEFESHSDEH